MEILSFFSLKPDDVLVIPISTVLFFLLWKLLDKNLFSPFLRLMEAREKMTEGALDHAQELSARAKRLRDETEGELRIARADAVKSKLSQVTEAQRQASEAVAEAERQGAAKLSEARTALISAMAIEREKALGAAEQLSQEVVAGVIGERLN